MKTKRKLPCQALPEGGSCFVATDLPSVGYRSYRRLFEAGPSTNAVTFAEGQMENEFYRVTLDATNGALKSILDKETGRELVDPESEYRLGELIYVSGGEGSYAIHSNLKGLPPPKFSYHRQTGGAGHAIQRPGLRRTGQRGDGGEVPEDHPARAALPRAQAH